VKTDSYFGGRLAARALLDAGCTRPVCVRYAESAAPYPPYGERLRGFSDFLAEAGIELPPERIFEVKSADDEDNFPGFLKRRISILKKTDSIFAFCDKQAIDTFHALRKLGFDVPGQISVIGFDGLILSRFLSPPLTTIRQPVEEIGRKALEIVLNPTESSAYAEVIRIHPEIQPGGTVRIKLEMKDER
jgi:LacI family transcriptional regulator